MEAVVPIEKVQEAADSIFGLSAVSVDPDQLAERFDPTPNPYLDDPARWVREKLGEETWSKSEEIFDSVVHNRYTAVQACHDSGKSHTGSRTMGWWIDSHPLGSAFVVSTAPTQTQVEAILWREVGKAHRLGDLPGRITSGMVPSWKLGQEIVGYGRKPQGLANKEEAMAAFQGIHAQYVLVVIDEAGGVPKWLFDAVDSLATNEAARVLAIGNPDDNSSQFAKVCAPGSGWNTIKIAASDTPNFSGEEVSEQLSQMLISRTWVEERKRRWGEKSNLYISKVLGEFPDISDDTLLTPSAIKAAQELELVGKARGTYGADIARYGDNETTLYRDRGGVIRLVWARHKQATTETAGMIANEVRPHNGAVPVNVDADGLGAGVYDMLREQGLPAVEFRGGMPAHDKERFINRRAEVYWVFREDVLAGAIDLPPEGEDDDLIAQLGAIKWYTDSKGRIGIESKDDMRKRGVASPDRADGAVYSHVRPSSWPRELSPKHQESSGETLTGDLMGKRM